MSDDMQPVGFSIPQDLLDDLDDTTAKWDDREAGTVHRSDVAREALTLGLVALEQLDTPEYRRLHTNERQAIVRQAILDWKREAENGE